MELSSMSITELQALQRQIEAELKRKQQQSMIDARQQILAIAKQTGLPLNELISGLPTQSGSAKAYKPVAVRYRHPEQSHLQWTGRGRAPAWVVAWEKQHSSREGIKVQAE
jgi:DNA-binding protein H-NS